MDSLQLRFPGHAHSHLRFLPPRQHDDPAPSVPEPITHATPDHVFAQISTNGERHHGIEEHWGGIVMQANNPCRQHCTFSIVLFGL
jgi:hypothetical protein